MKFFYHRHHTLRGSEGKNFRITQRLGEVSEERDSEIPLINGLITVLLSVTLIGSLWFWDTYPAHRRDIREMRTTCMQRQCQALQQQVEYALQYISFMRRKIPSGTEKKTEQQVKSEIPAWLEQCRWGKEKKELH